MVIDKEGQCCIVAVIFSLRICNNSLDLRFTHVDGSNEQRLLARYECCHLFIFDALTDVTLSALSENRPVGTKPEMASARECRNP